MKYKVKKDVVVPRENSFSGLNTTDFHNLNNGKTVELDFLPKAAEPFLESVGKEKKKDGNIN